MLYDYAFLRYIYNGVIILPRFTDRTISEIKNRISIRDVMSNYATIESRGGGQFWVKCPFHGGGNEKTASCKLNIERGTYYCFGCRETGDIFTLIEKKEGLDFSGAVEYLARKAGVELEESTVSDKKSKDEKEMLYDLYSRLASMFAFYLKERPEGEEAREYLRKRNVSDEMREAFLLGYAPKSPGFLYAFLRKKGYSEDFLAKSGLFSQKNPKWPLFTDRLMFPIRDRQGRVIAFSGRDLSGSDKTPKYINSPETRLYQKKENFFGLFEAKKSIAAGSWPILCEGNFDVVAMHQAGFTSALASLGTSFTEEQGALIRRWYPEIKGFNLLFDSDEAGQKSSERAILILNRLGFAVKAHKFTSAKDASELLEKGGKSAVEKEFAPAIDGYDYLVQTYAKRYDIQSAKGKSGFIRAIGNFILGNESPIERDSYIMSLAVYLNASEEAVREELNRGQIESGSAADQSSNLNDINTGNKGGRRISIDLFLMLYLANHRSLFRTEYRRKIAFADLEDNEAQIIYMALENAIRNGVESDELFLTLINDERCRNDVAATYALDEYRDDDPKAIDEAVDRIALRALEKRRVLINNQLRLYSGTLNSEESQELLRSKSDLDKEIEEYKHKLSSIQ